MPICKREKISSFRESYDWQMVHIGTVFRKVDLCLILHKHKYKKQVVKETELGKY